MDALARHQESISGPQDGQPMVFADGFGCDKTMWRHVASALADRNRAITFDHIGPGGSDLSAYDPQKYADLQVLSRSWRRPSASTSW